MKQNNLLCCDWGTSNFRLYLIDISTTKIRYSLSSEQGISLSYDQWKNKGKNDRIVFFRNLLQESIQELSEKSKTALKNVPVILSGMASSSIGMMEIPYEQVPFTIDHPNLALHYFPASQNFPNELFLFGGLCTATDVMRGEEVQLLGLQHLIDAPSCVCLLPGTHSKHIWIENKTVVDFQTFMTGECFQIISSNSILKGSIKKGKNFDETASNYFQKGVKKAQNTNILNSLFSVRTNTLLKNVTHASNYYYLSGLLIGQELRSLTNFKGQLLLNCSNELAVLYQLALKTLALDKYLTTISEQDLQQCIPKAHLKLYQQQL